MSWNHDISMLSVEVKYHHNFNSSLSENYFLVIFLKDWILFYFLFFIYCCHQKKHSCRQCNWNASVLKTVQT